MGSISVILRKPPYGSVDAPEAIRHALGGITEDMDVKLILVDGGVHVARKNQDTSNTEYLSAEDGIKDCIGMGASVYADKVSLANELLGADDIADGIIIASGAEIAEVIRESGVTMIF